MEVVDVRSLLPFDRTGRILDSLKKTSRIVFMDEGRKTNLIFTLMVKKGSF